MTAPAASVCKCCGQAADDRGLSLGGFCAPCFRGQHTKTCRLETKAAAAKEAKDRAAAKAAAKPAETAGTPPPAETAKTAAAAAPSGAPGKSEPGPTPESGAAIASPGASQAPKTASEPAREPQVVALEPVRPAPEGAPTTGLARIPAGPSGLELRTLDDLWRFSSAVAKSGMLKGFDTPEKVLVAVQFGAEVGLSPMQSLQNVGVINGRAGLHSDAPLALVRASRLLEDFDEWFEHAGARVDEWPATPNDESRAVCLVKRRGERELVRSFSVREAKLAGLWGKTGQGGQPTPWVTFPGRMMRFKARNGQALRDAFPDILKGLATTDELIARGDDEADAPPMPRRKSEAAS